MKNFLNIFILCVMTLFCSLGFGMTKENFLAGLEDKIKNIVDNTTDAELDLIAPGFVTTENIRNKYRRIVKFFSNRLKDLPEVSVFFTDENYANYLYQVIENSLKDSWENTVFYTEPINLDLQILNIDIKNDIIQLFDYIPNNEKKKLLIDYVKEHVVSLLPQDLLQSILNDFKKNETYRALNNPIRKARAFGLLRRYLYWYKKNSGFFQTNIEFNILRRGAVMNYMIEFINAAQDASGHDKNFTIFKEVPQEKEQQARQTKAQHAGQEKNMTWLERFIYRNLYNKEEVNKEKTIELAQYIFNQINYFSSRLWHQYRWSSIVGVLGLTGSAIWLINKNLDKFKKVKATGEGTKITNINPEQKKIDFNVRDGAKSLKVPTTPTQENVQKQPNIVNIKSNEIPQMTEKSWRDIIGAGFTKTKNFLQDLFKRGGSPEAIERREMPPLIR